MSNATKCPCYECELRKPSCHSACDAYIDWAKRREAQKKQSKSAEETEIMAYYHAKRYKGR